MVVSVALAVPNRSIGWLLQGVLYWVAVAGSIVLGGCCREYWVGAMACSRVLKPPLDVAEKLYTAGDERWVFNDFEFRM